MSKTRTFIAIALPPAALDALSQMVRQFRAGPSGEVCRWADLATVHLTLRFLGDTETTLLSRVYAASDCAAREALPFALDIAGLGCFPNMRSPRIVWAGVRDSSASLAPLVERLERELQALGFEPERRRYHPHITLGRVRSRVERDQVEELGRAIADWPADTTTRVSVRDIIVFGSELTPSGPIHTRLHTSPLGDQA